MVVHRESVRASIIESTDVLYFIFVLRSYALQSNGVSVAFVQDIPRFDHTGGSGCKNIKTGFPSFGKWLPEN